jgi:hypothetical protein
MTEQQTEQSIEQQGAAVLQGIHESQQGNHIDHPELRKGFKKLQAHLDERVAKIREDRRLDKGEQQQQLQAEWNRAMEYRGQMMKAYEDHLEEDSAERERSLFSVIPANRDSVRQAYNDLYDRTTPGYLSGDPEGIEHARNEMERLWERAIRTGDRALETAIGQLAMERGEEKLRDAYLARSPEKTKAWQRYGEARTKLDNFKDPKEHLWGNLTQGWTLSKPPELR